MSKKEFDLKNTMRAIDTYAEKCFFETKDTEYKVFYNLFEGGWGFWKFHLKAIRHQDWKSIKGWWTATLKQDK